MTPTDGPITPGEQYNPPLQVVRLVATRVRDPERGPRISMRPDDASLRMLTDGELVWVITPRRQQLAALQIDDSLPRGAVVLRDVVGASPSEIVHVTKVDTDTRRRSDLA